MSSVRILTPSDERRLCAGLAVQPFVAAIVAIVSSPLLTNRPFGEVAAGIALSVGIWAVMITALCVFPTVIWMVKRWPVSLTTALVFGLAFANLPAIVTVVLVGGNRNIVALHAFVSLIGMAGAAAFWAISVRGRDFGRGPTAA